MVQQGRGGTKGEREREQAMGSLACVVVYIPELKLVTLGSLGQVAGAPEAEDPRREDSTASAGQECGQLMALLMEHRSLFSLSPLLTGHSRCTHYLVHSSSTVLSK